MSSSPTPARRWTFGATLLLWQVIAWTVVDLVIASWDRDDQMTLLVLGSMTAAQLATLAGWLALGDGHVAQRLLTVVASIGLTELVGQLHGAEAGDLAAVATAFIAVLSLPLLVLRLFGWACRQPHDTSAGELRAFQFSIWQILLLTACVAVLLGLFRILPRPLLYAAATADVAALIVGILSWTQWIVMLRPNLETTAPVGFLVLLGSCIAADVALGANGGLGIALVAVHTATLGINLYFFRAGGYRLLRLAR